MKESKRSYFTNYFQNKLSELERLKNLISLKELPIVAPSNIFEKVEV